MAGIALNSTLFTQTRSISLSALAVAALMALTPQAQAQSADQCSHRGQLDTQYCDENKDLVADAPKDPKKWRDPSALVWAYTPVEDPAIYANVFKPFTDFLEKCVNKKIIYYPVQSNSAEIEAMRKQYDESKKGLEQRFLDKVEKLQRGDELPPGVMKMVKVFVAVKRKLQPGDKMAGRHGNKGVISKILPPRICRSWPTGATWTSCSTRWACRAA